jgi:ribosomal protein L32
MLVEEPETMPLFIDKREIEAGDRRTVPMLLTCPICTERHIDEAAFAVKAHHTHACQNCGHVWRPAKINTHGVRFLPGYSNVES